MAGPFGLHRRRQIAGACGAALLMLGCQSPPAQESGRTTAKEPERTGLFERSKLQLRDLTVWRGSVVAEYHGEGTEPQRFYRVDAARGVARRLRIAHGELVAVGRGDALAHVSNGQLKIEVGHASPQATYALPRNVSRLLLDHDAQQAAVAVDRAVFVRTTNAWREVPVEARGADNGLPDRLLLAGPRAYLGFNFGEWGGGITAIDVRTGSAAQEPGKDAMPVTDIALHDGRPWVVEGLAHLSEQRGRLRTYANNEWQVIASVSRSGEIPTVDWPLPPTSFVSIAFDADGAVCLLGYGLGVICRRGAEWKQLTTGWPKSVDVHALEWASRDEAVIGAMRMGLVVWNVASGEARKIVLDENAEVVTP